MNYVTPPSRVIANLSETARVLTRARLMMSHSRELLRQHREGERREAEWRVAAARYRLRARA